MSKEVSEVKNFNMRLSKDLWVFLKNESTAKETSMTDIITSCIEKHRKKIENKLTLKDTSV